VKITEKLSRKFLSFTNENIFLFDSLEVEKPSKGEDKMEQYYQG